MTTAAHIFYDYLFTIVDVGRYCTATQGASLQSPIISPDSLLPWKIQKCVVTEPKIGVYDQ